MEQVGSDVFCDTLLSVLDQVIDGTITQEHSQEEPQSSTKLDSTVEGDRTHSEYNELIKLIKCMCTERRVIGNNTDLLTGGYNGEENEDEPRGYIDRTIQLRINRNFINKCKAERIHYASGFTSCVGIAASNLLKNSGEEREVDDIMLENKSTETKMKDNHEVKNDSVESKSDLINLRLRLNKYYHWPEPPYEWQDNDETPEEDESIEVPDEPVSDPLITISNTPREMQSKCWQTAKYIDKKQWEDLPRGRRRRRGRRQVTFPRILHHDVDEDIEEDISPPRYPDVNITIPHISTQPDSSFRKHGKHMQAWRKPQSFNSLRHFLGSLSVGLKMCEERHILSYQLRYSTTFVPNAAGQRVAEEIDKVLRKSVKTR